MRHLLGTSTILLALLLLQSTAWAQITKEEKKFWKDKAKMYVKNPVALKAEFENYQDQIKDLKARNKTLTEKASSQQNSEQLDSLRWALIQLEGENQALNNQIDKMKLTIGSQTEVMTQNIKTGLIYRVQIGAYVFHEMENAPGEAKDFVAERADGFNKYMIGMFRTYDECDEFRGELAKLGIKDAWIVPYIDGVRVTINEANEYLKNQGQTTFMNN